jgi:hypothetical protein
MVTGVLLVGKGRGRARVGRTLLLMMGMWRGRIYMIEDVGGI